MEDMGAAYAHMFPAFVSEVFIGVVHNEPGPSFSTEMCCSLKLCSFQENPCDHKKMRVAGYS
jgi:hypothetical protein